MILDDPHYFFSITDSVSVWHNAELESSVSVTHIWTQWNVWNHSYIVSVISAFLQQRKNHEVSHEQ